MSIGINQFLVLSSRYDFEWANIYDPQNEM